MKHSAIKMEKYKHSPEDKKNDLILIKQFSQQFLTKFEQVLHLSIYRDCAFRDYLGYGAECIYLTKDNLMIWVSTDINPNGINEQIGIRRVFTIECNSKAKFYDFAFESETIIEKFSNFICPVAFTNDDFYQLPFKYILT
ncbi:MAG: hypothetical protein ACOYLE_05520 [Bacteroidales bacterium]